MKVLLRSTRVIWDLIGWAVWVGTLIFLFIQWSIWQKSRDGGVRLLSGRVALVTTFGFLASNLPGVSKLHLIWFVPVAYALTMAWSMRQMETSIHESIESAMASNSLASLVERAGPDAEVGLSIPWSKVLRRVYRVTDLDPAGTTMQEDGQVVAADANRAYGYLEVVSPDLPHSFRLPIAHRDDFKLVAWAFEDRLWEKLGSDGELLVTYVPQKVTKHGLSGDDRRMLHYVVCPQGTLAKIYSAAEQPPLEAIFGELAYYGEIGIQINEHPKI